MIASSALSLTSSQWYTGKVVVDDDPGNSALQRLRFWVDTDQDADFSDETAQIDDTSVIDGNWSAGYAGLFSGPISSAAVQEFDDVKIGLDNSSPKDGDYADAGDSVIIDDNFDSNSTSLTFDDNGNLTDDGIFNFVYDAWNRLVAARTRYASGTTRTTIGTYAYDGAGRRTKKVVANNGVEIVANDGGNATVNFYYSNRWQILETRSGSNQTTFQYAWGRQYLDEPIFMDRQGDGSGNDVDPDSTAGGESANLDHRCFYHQDRNWNVTALTDYGSGVNGQLAERSANTPYGDTVVLSGGVPEFSRASFASPMGSPFTYHALFVDSESPSRHNRYRSFYAALGRFFQRDPLSTGLSPTMAFDDLNVYSYLHHHPTHGQDPNGLCLVGSTRTPPFPFGQTCGLCGHQQCNFCQR